MSAYVVPREHIHVIVRVGLEGPRGVAVSPDSAWHELSWHSEDPRAVAWDPSDPDRYFRDMAAIRRVLNRDTADRVGAMLTTANVASVRHRYPDDDDSSLPGTYTGDRGDWTRPYAYVPMHRATVAEALKALDGYEYQACELPGWAGSEAARFCDALRRALIHRVPGYDAAPWEWGATEVADAAALAH